MPKKYRQIKGNFLYSFAQGDLTLEEILARFEEVEEEKECQKRWTEHTLEGNKVGIYCGHALPCPDHNPEEKEIEKICIIKGETTWQIEMIKAINELKSAVNELRRREK